MIQDAFRTTIDVLRTRKWSIYQATKSIRSGAPTVWISPSIYRLALLSSLFIYILTCPVRFNLQTWLKSLSSLELLASERLDWAAVTYYSSQCNRQILLFWKRGRKSKQKQLINMCIFICFGKEKLSRYKEYNTFTNDTAALDYCFGLFWVRSCHVEKCFCPFLPNYKSAKTQQKKTKQYQSQLWTLSLDTISQQHRHQRSDEELHKHLVAL